GPIGEEVVDDHVGALLGQHLGDPLAHPLAGAGDQRRASPQRAHRGVPSSSWTVRPKFSMLSRLTVIWPVKSTGQSQRYSVPSTMASIGSIWSGRRRSPTSLA